MLTVEWTPELKLDCAYYDREGAESLHFDSLDEYLEDCLQHDVSDPISELLADDATVEVFGYRRMMPSRLECQFLEQLIQDVDEERGDPDGYHTPINDESRSVLEAAENAFINLFLSHYDPYGRESVVKIIVPFRKWWVDQSEATREILADCTCGDDCTPPCPVHATLKQIENYDGGLGVME